MRPLQLIDEGERAPQRLRRKALDLADETIRRLDGIASDGAKAVHDVRRSLKELRALASLLGARRADRALFRDAGRRLSAARDAKAAVEAFDRLREGFASEWKPREFAKIRRALKERATTSVDAITIDELRSMLAVERGRIAAWTVDEMTRDELWSSIRGTRRRSRRAMNAAAEEPSPERFHDWRKRIKTLWHQSAFLASVGLADLDEDIDALHRLSRMLGEQHDLAIIDDLCRRTPEIFGTSRYVRRFRTFVARRLRELEATAEALGSEILADGGRKWEQRVRRERVRQRIGPKRADAAVRSRAMTAYRA